MESFQASDGSGSCHQQEEAENYSDAAHFDAVLWFVRLPRIPKIPQHSRRPKQQPEANTRKDEQCDWQKYCEHFRPLLIEPLALRIEDFEITEEGGLRLDLSAVADHHDLHVRGIEIFARRFEQIRWR